MLTLEEETTEALYPPPLPPFLPCGASTQKPDKRFRLVARPILARPDFDVAGKKPDEPSTLNAEQKLDVKLLSGPGTGLE
jgi:hypothetical protein